MYDVGTLIRVVTCAIEIDGFRTIFSVAEVRCIGFNPNSSGLQWPIHATSKTSVSEGGIATNL